MRNTTLVYIERDDSFLMLLRNRKEVDENKGKWIGVGGKFEEGESPEDCLLRETYEETGLRLTAYSYRAVITFVSDEWGTEYMHLFTATGFEGKLKDCDEGELRWIPKSEIMDLNLWEGDKAFLPLIFTESPFFTMRLEYKGDQLVKIDRSQYGLPAAQVNEAEIRRKYRQLTESLIDRGLSITTMESITSGLIASLITDTEGASAVLKGAFVTYSNEAKIKQGVSEEILNRYTVYSEETALEMAENCRRAYGARIGVGVTGTAGNVDPANAGTSEPGKVYFAIAYDLDEIPGHVVRTIELSPDASRYHFKLAVAEKICDCLSDLLREKQ